MSLISRVIQNILTPIIVFLPINHFASKIVVKAQDDLMKTRDERVSLMNEVSLYYPPALKTCLALGCLRFLEEFAC